MPENISRVCPAQLPKHFHEFEFWEGPSSNPESLLANITENTEDAICSLCQICTDTVTARHQAFSLALAPPAPWLFLGRRTAWMLGNTPPWAMVTPDMSLFSSSSFLRDDPWVATVALEVTWWPTADVLKGCGISYCPSQCYLHSQLRITAA